LQLDPLLKRAQVIPKMRHAGALHAREHAHRLALRKREGEGERGVRQCNAQTRNRSKHSSFDERGAERMREDLGVEREG